MTKPTFPNLIKKYESHSLVSPEKYIAYQRRHGHVPDTPFPEDIILCYQKALMTHIEANHILSKGYGFLHSLYFLDCNGKTIGLHQIKNAPEAVIKLEEMTHLSAKRFLSIGTAGSLQPSLTYGDIVLCSGALRDDGVSQHYLPQEIPATPSPLLLKKLQNALEAHGLPYHAGETWTTPAIYRETEAELAHYQKQGILCVDMEAAALFTVAKYLKVELASLFTISDDLSSGEWEPDFHSNRVQGGLETLFRIACETLS